jgi:hypothetical protein
MPLDPVTELAGLAGAFEAEGVGYALCGGLALAVHGHARATKDIDFLVPRDELDRAIDLARRTGFDLLGPKLTFGRRTQTPREIRRLSKLDTETGQLLTLDLLVVNPALEQVWTQRLSVTWLGRPLCVVSREGLATMKRIAGRAQDLADLAKLEGTDDEDEG